MSIYEYDEELHERTMIDIGREEGLQKGLEKGNIIGKIQAYHDCGKTPEEISELVPVSVEYVNEVLHPSK